MKRTTCTVAALVFGLMMGSTSALAASDAAVKEMEAY